MNGRYEASVYVCECVSVIVILFMQVFVFDLYGEREEGKGWSFWLVITSTGLQRFLNLVTRRQ